MPWKELELDPDGVVERDVKRAYARLLKQRRPDKDPEGFRRLRDAYKEALWLIKSGVPFEHEASIEAIEEEAMEDHEGLLTTAPKNPEPRNLEGITLIDVIESLQSHDISLPLAVVDHWKSQKQSDSLLRLGKEILSEKAHLPLDEMRHFCMSLAGDLAIIDNQVANELADLSYTYLSPDERDWGWSETEHWLTIGKQFAKFPQSDRHFWAECLQFSDDHLTLWPEQQLETAKTSLSQCVACHWAGYDLIRPHLPNEVWSKLDSDRQRLSKRICGFLTDATFMSILGGAVIGVVAAIAIPIPFPFVSVFDVEPSKHFTPGDRSAVIEKVDSQFKERHMIWLPTTYITNPWLRQAVAHVRQNGFDPATWESDLASIPSKAVNSESRKTVFLQTLILTEVIPLQERLKVVQTMMATTGENKAAEILLRSWDVVDNESVKNAIAEAARQLLSSVGEDLPNSKRNRLKRMLAGTPNPPEVPENPISLTTLQEQDRASR